MTGGSRSAVTRSLISLRWTPLPRENTHLTRENTSKNTIDDKSGNTIENSREDTRENTRENTVKNKSENTRENTRGENSVTRSLITLLRTPAMPLSFSSLLAAESLTMTMMMMKVAPQLLVQYEDDSILHLAVTEHFKNKKKVYRQKLDNYLILNSSLFQVVQQIWPDMTWAGWGH